MAFMQRGYLNSNNESRNDNSKNNNASPDVNAYVYFRMDLRMYAMLEILAIVVFLIVFLFAYQPKIVDPIKNIKSNIIALELLILVGVLVSTIVMSFLHKDDYIMLKRRIFNILILSAIAILLFVGIGLYMDRIYTKEKFEEFYNELESPFEGREGKEGSLTQITTPIVKNNEIEYETYNMPVDFSKVGLKTSHQYYINESMTLYNIFKVRRYGILGFYVIFDLLLLFKILKLEKNQKYKERLAKDDLIVYDEEQNIRF